MNNPNVNFPTWGKYGNTSHLGEHTARQNLTVFFVHVLAQRFYFTHIYIMFLLGVLNYIQTNGERKCFELI